MVRVAQHWCYLTLRIVLLQVYFKLILMLIGLLALLSLLLLIDLFNSTIAARAIRFRCIESAGDPVRLKYFGVHKAPVFDEYGSVVNL